MNMNTVTFEGNLVDAPQLSITPDTQTAVAEAVGDCFINGVSSVFI